MADINSNKNAIIIQPITLQIRAPFQFLTNHRAIKHTHYSESRDGLNYGGPQVSRQNLKEASQQKLSRQKFL